MPASSLPPSLPTQPLSVTSSSSYNDLTQTFGQLGISPQYGSIQSVGLPQQSSIANAFGPTQTLHTQFSGSIGQPVMTQPHMPYSSMPPQFFQQTFRGFARGRGRGPRLPCDICGRSNHTTNYCYYRTPSPSFFPKSPWGPHVQTSPQNSPWMSHSAPWMNPYPYTYPTGLPMYQPSIPQSPSMISSQTTRPNVTTPQPAFAGFTETCSVPYMDQFSGVPYMDQFSGYYPGNSTLPNAFPVNNRGSQYPTSAPACSSVASTSNSSSQPWYFDSGATNHITNNLQNLTNPQPAHVTDGILVGNGSHLQVSHTGKGQEYSQSLVQGTMSQGTVPHSDLL